jgi:sulfatase modifying factor 1
MLLRTLFFFLLPLSALAQDCDCCKIRTLGQEKYDAGDYPGAKSTWETAKKMGDAAKCTDLDALIAKAKKKIPVPKPKPSTKQTPADPVTTIPSPATHGKKSGLTMIPVEGGTYTMGSPATEPNRFDYECQHIVTVGNFSIGQYEVTQADWQEVMGTNPSSSKDSTECPVESVSWTNVQEFIKAANQKYGRNFRLPTEAEWEYAARGGKKSMGYRYSGSNDINEVAWYPDTAERKLHTIGCKKPNELGLYDMSGNVWEWCSDVWAPYEGCPEPKERDSTSRVVRGGSWFYYYYNSRVANRYKNFHSSIFNDLGFRLAQD